MKNEQILKTVLYATLLEQMDGDFKLKLRIDDRDLVIISCDNPESESVDDLEIRDLETGELIAIQPAEDFFQPIDIKWLNKECETAYSLNY